MVPPSKNSAIFPVFYACIIDIRYIYTDTYIRNIHITYLPVLPANLFSLAEALASNPNLCGLKSSYKDEVIGSAFSAGGFGWINTKRHM